MSEEILKALMQLFALIVKQDEGVEELEIEYVRGFLTQQLSPDAVEEYMSLFISKAGVARKKKDPKRKPKLTSVRDSVRILGICKKINKKLNQKQKVVVLVRLFELVNADRKFSDQRMAIINTVAEVFNISKDEFKSIETFVIKNEIEELDNESILIINDKEDKLTFQSKQLKTESLDANIFILRIKSTELYFLRYTGNEDINLNGLSVYNNRIYLFATGSTTKLPKGKPIYYSDVVSTFLSDKTVTKLSFIVKDVSYVFKSGGIGLRNINFGAGHGNLIGIMGASGAGKTTLLNLLSGMVAPTEGDVKINGINLHTEKDKIEGVIGYIPQDDLLIEELTVFQNLYYSAKLCFKNKSDEEIIELVNITLKNLGLYERKDLRVGSPLNKMISGGQRKRLNIALELIREPSILFVDEPTSGLSSRDSENVMDLLRELTLKGKLIFVVIHQPSSEIYKMFDRMVILDSGGYLIYYGNPVQAIVHFKTLDNQINSDLGECAECGNVTPELIFNIVEAQVVDEFGQYTGDRKVTPIKWEKNYNNNVEIEEIEEINEEPPASLSIPKWFSQFKIFSIRDILSKVSNTQYIVLNMGEAPLLGFILSYIIRYIADPNSSKYIFFDNENIPPYIFMSIVVALFLGLTVSAEEIFKDRKILKREEFLNLSRSSYLFSKVIILTTISAIQAILFVLVGNNILGIERMIFEYWLVLFSVFAFSNMLGLNISSSFNSAVTIYILIPLLMIPQMALGGAMFSFDKLNRTIGSIGKVPMIAEIMISRWSYEALMVHQFKNNAYEKDYYEIDKNISYADFKQVHYLPAISEKIDENLEYIETEMNDSIKKIIKANFSLIINELNKEAKIVPTIPFTMQTSIHIEGFNDSIAEELKEHIKAIDSYYAKMFNVAQDRKEEIINYLNEKSPGYYRNRRKKYHNEKLQDIVKNAFEKNKILQYKNNLIQQIDPIFLNPETSSFFGFRTHFYAPKKHFAGKLFETFWFNVIIIWLMTLFLYIPLYYNLLKRFVDFFGSVETKKFLGKIKTRNSIKTIKEKRINKKK